MLAFAANAAVPRSPEGSCPLVNQYGGAENAYNALQQAVNEQVSGESGIFEQAVNVGDNNVVVRGIVTNGVRRIGTAFIP